MSVKKEERKAKLVGDLAASVGYYTLDGSIIYPAMDAKSLTVDLDHLKDLFEKHYRIRPKATEIVIKGLIRYPDGTERIEHFDLTPDRPKVGTKKTYRSKVKQKRRKGK